MIGFILVLLAIWLVLAVFGAIIEGLFWLTIIGAVLFIGTAAYGLIKHRSKRSLS